MKSNTVKQLTLCLILVVSSLFAKSQTVSCYFPSEYTADVGSILTVDVKMDSFTNVGGFQLSIMWDTDLLEYKEAILQVDHSELSGLNESKVDEGKVGVAWISPSGAVGVTLPDSTTLCSFRFEVVGDVTGTTPLEFIDEPLERGFFSPEGTDIASTYADGSVMLMGASNTSYNSAPDHIRLYPPTPNPFYENTYIKIDLRQAAQTNIKIVDQLGKVLHDEQQYLGAGLQTIPITKDIFTQSGTYYCLLYGSDFRVMQKIVFIDR
ncbi:MAG: T9SS type A sorting domain-containing protein [Saprospiraceae bacterium]